MKTLKTLSILVILVIAGGFLIARFSVQLVPLSMVGVRIQQYSILGEKGVEEKDFHPGWHWNLGPLHQWEIFDSTVQTLEMTSNPKYGDRRADDTVRIQSVDGATIWVDISIKYKIKKGLAHKVYQDTGGGQNYKQVVRTEARDACFIVLGKMRTEEFYNNPTDRRNKAGEIKNVLNESLSNNFLEVIDVFIRNIRFKAAYENKIRNKKLKDQEVELNKSKAKAAEMRGKTQVIEAETIKLVKIITKEKEAELIRMEAGTNRDITKIRADYEKYSTEKNADADLIASQKEAEGGFLVKNAEAEGEKMRNRAMQGVGGSTIVALEAAKNINLSNITVSTLNIDFLDIDKMATKLGVSDKK